MVLAAIIPTADGAVWHGRSAIPAAHNVSSSGRQSSRLAGKTLALVGAAGAAGSPAELEPPATHQAALPAGGASKRGKPSDKGGKRKRDDDCGAERRDAAASQSEPKTAKEKKEHDKYCHFCQVLIAPHRRLLDTIGAGMRTLSASLTSL